MSMTQNIFSIDLLDELHLQVRRLSFEVAYDLVDIFLRSGQHFAFLDGDQKYACRLGVHSFSSFYAGTVAGGKLPESEPAPRSRSGSCMPWKCAKSCSSG